MNSFATTALIGTICMCLAIVASEANDRFDTLEPDADKYSTILGFGDALTKASRASTVTPKPLELSSFTVASKTIRVQPTGNFNRTPTTTVRPFHGQIPRPSVIFNDEEDSGEAQESTDGMRPLISERTRLKFSKI